jgi:hypothetical protein
MSEQQTSEPVTLQIPENIPVASADKRAKSSKTPATWLRENREPLLVCVILLAIFVAAIMFVQKTASDVKEAMALSNRESAYTDVYTQHVAVNGPRGTVEWRGDYKLGLERYLGENDFSDSCAYNGFLKDSNTPGLLPCVAVGDLRAVRSSDGSIAYFKEDAWRRKVTTLDVMEQDVHDERYLDIDSFSKAVEDRASKLKGDEDNAKREKEQVEFKTQMQDYQRIIDETEQTLKLIPVRPQTVFPDTPKLDLR